MRALIMLVAGTLAAAAALPSAAVGSAQAESVRAAQPTELSAQSRRRTRRTRVTVRPTRPGLSPPGYGTGADLSRWKRACVPVFIERNIPQWGGPVLYASQRCRWVLE